MGTYYEKWVTMLNYARRQIDDIMYCEGSITTTSIIVYGTQYCAKYSLGFLVVNNLKRSLRFILVICP